MTIFLVISRKNNNFHSAEQIFQRKERHHLIRLCDILHDNLKHIVLGHLSKENNYAKLAYETVKLEVTLADNEYKGDDLDMFVANRDTVSDIITV